MHPMIYVNKFTCKITNMGDDLPSYISQDISESILLNDNPIDTEESLTLEKQSLNSLPGG